MLGYLALQCGAWLTWACLTFASVIPSCSFTFARVIPSCFLLLQESSLHSLSFLLNIFWFTLQSTGAIPTRFGVTVLSTSLYSCNFLRELRIEIKFLPISSTVYFAPEELDFASVRLKSFSVCPVKFVYRSRAISTAENLLSSAARFKARLLVVA